MSDRVPLSRITLDAELQPRAEIDRHTWEDYAFHLSEGAILPPVLVVQDGDTCWLADGFHRYHAHAALGFESIEAELREGTRADALRLSLLANATHGKPRTPGDHARAYAIAVSNALVEPTDSIGLMRLTGCSIRTAENLTRQAREAAKVERDAAIRAKEAEGLTQREIAKATGASKGTVSRALGGAPKAQTAQMGQPLAASLLPDPDMPLPAMGPSVAAALARLESPAALMWHDTLNALRTCNACELPAVLSANPYPDLDHAILPELRAAKRWIDALGERFGQGAG